MSLPKIVAVCMGALMAFDAHVPLILAKPLYVLLVFLATDIVAQVRIKSVCKDMAQTRRIGERVLTRIVQYLIVGVGTAGISILTENMWFLQAGLLGIIGVEFLCMVEGLAALENCGGANMRRITPLLRIVGKYLPDYSEGSQEPKK